MPAWLAPLVGSSLGALFAWSMRRFQGQKGRNASAASSTVAWFAVLVFAPIAAYFTLRAGDWAVAYAFASSEVPIGLSLGWIALSTSSVSAAFAATTRALDEGRLRAATALAIAPTMTLVAAVVALAPRLRLVGTYRMFSGGFGMDSIVGTALGYTLAAMSAILVLGAVVTIRALRGTESDASADGIPVAEPRLLGAPRRRDANSN